MLYNLREGIDTALINMKHEHEKYIIYDPTKAYNCVIQLTPKISIPLLFYVQILRFRHISEG